MKEKIRKVDFSTRFLKQHKKASIEIKRAWLKRFKLFNQNAFHPQLNNHQLSGRYKGFRSINITDDWRALYSINKINKENVAIFEALGTHSQL